MSEYIQFVQRTLQITETVKTVTIAMQAITLQCKSVCYNKDKRKCTKTGREWARNDPTSNHIHFAMHAAESHRKLESECLEKDL
jgi:hypothetical protein